MAKLATNIDCLLEVFFKWYLQGEVIRSEVGEMREKRYVAQNRGVYMFRIDEDLLVDATMAGGPARLAQTALLSDPILFALLIHGHSC